MFFALADILSLVHVIIYECPGVEGFVACYISAILSLRTGCMKVVSFAILSIQISNRLHSENSKFCDPN